MAPRKVPCAPPAVNHVSGFSCTDAALLKVDSHGATRYGTRRRNRHGRERIRTCGEDLCGYPAASRPLGWVAESSRRRAPGLSSSAPRKYMLSLSESRRSRAGGSLRSAPATHSVAQTVEEIRNSCVWDKPLARQGRKDRGKQEATQGEPFPAAGWILRRDLLRLRSWRRIPSMQQRRRSWGAARLYAARPLTRAVAWNNPSCDVEFQHG